MRIFNLVLIFVFVCLGIIFAYYFRLNFWFFYFFGFFLLLVFSFVRQRWLSLVLLCVLSFIFGVILLRNSLIYPADHIRNNLELKGTNVSVVGIIEDEPSIKDKKLRFILKTEKIKKNQKWFKTQGRILLTVYLNKVPDQEFAPYQRIIISGRIFKRKYPKQGLNYRNYLKAHGISFDLGIKPEKIRIISQLKPPILFGLPLVLRKKIESRLKAILLSSTYKILKAMILGDRQDLGLYLKNMLINIGTFHIIAISGLHIGIISFSLWMFLKLLRIRRVLRIFLISFVLIFYAFVVGLRPSVMRAVIMTLSFIFGYLFKRKPNLYTLLAFSGLILVIGNPWQLFEVGFQLSFLSVFFILWLSPKIRELLKYNLIKKKLLRNLVFLFSCTFSVWLGVFPLLIYYFRIFSWISILANLLIIPYISLVICAGIVLIIMGIFDFGPIKYFSLGTDFLVYILFKVNLLFSGIKKGYFDVPSSFSLLIYYYILLFFFFNYSSIKKFLLYRIKK